MIFGDTIRVSKKHKSAKLDTVKESKKSVRLFWNANFSPISDLLIFFPAQSETM